MSECDKKEMHEPSKTIDNNWTFPFTLIMLRVFCPEYKLKLAEILNQFKKSNSEHIKTPEDEKHLEEYFQKIEAFYKAMDALKECDNSVQKSE